MTQVLVTGGLGFIGSHTVDLLIKKGYDVVILDNLDKQIHNGKKPDYTNKKAKCIIKDIRYKSNWIKALKNTDFVIHLAAKVGISQSFWEVRKYMDVNVSGTAQLFDILIKNKDIKNKVKKLVVASSKSLYGEGAYKCETHGIIYPEIRPREQLIAKRWEVTCNLCGKETVPVAVTEEKPPQNLNPYSLSKYATEKLAMEYAYSIGIPAVAFRYFNVYGPRQSLSNPYNGVIAIFLSRLKNGHPPKLFEDGRQLRDFVYIEDVARLNVLALERGEGVFNLGTGQGNSLIDIVSLLKKKLRTSLEPEISQEFRPGDTRHDFADISKLNKYFGKQNFLSLEEGLNKLVDWSATAEAIDRFDKQEKERKMYLNTKE